MRVIGLMLSSCGVRGSYSIFSVVVVRQCLIFYCRRAWGILSFLTLPVVVCGVLRATARAFSLSFISREMRLERRVQLLKSEIFLKIAIIREHCSAPNDAHTERHVNHDFVLGSGGTECPNADRRVSEAAVGRGSPGNPSGGLESYLETVLIHGVRHIAYRVGVRPVWIVAASTYIKLHGVRCE